MVTEQFRKETYTDNCGRIGGLTRERKLCNRITSGGNKGGPGWARVGLPPIGPPATRIFQGVKKNYQFNSM